MQQDLMRYDLLVQDALKGVVRRVLVDAARDGLLGEHHFYISFRTDYPGARVSTRLRDKYPQEMTIVLQHQFWDLIVTEHSFEVGLSFSGIPERLLVPFDALTGFFDPSVQFGLKFEIKPIVEDVEAQDIEAKPSIKKAPSKAVRDNKSDTKSKEPARLKTTTKLEKTSKSPVQEVESTAQVVSLDAFRKKT